MDDGIRTKRERDGIRTKRERDGYEQNEKWAPLKQRRMYRTVRTASYSNLARNGRNVVILIME